MPKGQPLAIGAGSNLERIARPWDAPEQNTGLTYVPPLDSAERTMISPPTLGEYIADTHLSFVS